MSAFEQQFAGFFHGVLRWSQLDSLWQRVRSSDGWYVYFVGQELPSAPLDAEALQRFITELDALLRREHDYDYCGIVYVDSLEAPTMVKVFDPHHLGSSCGSSGMRILPRWVLSQSPPVPLEVHEVTPQGRKRWWRTIFAHH
jgi:hypothetical protein